MKPRTFAAAAVVSAAALAGSAAGLTAAGTHPAQTSEGVCDQLTTGHLSAGGATTVTFTAPAGFLVVTFCVKAGSIVQGDGPEYTNVNPAVATVTISHSSGKEISHYSVLYKPIPPTPTTTTSSTTTTTENPCPNPPCIPDTQTPTTSTTTSTSVAPTTTPSSPPSTTTSTSTTTTSTSSPPPTTSSTTSTTTTLPANLDIGGASTICRRDAPFVTLTFGNQPEFNGHVGTITFVDINGDTIETHSVTYQANGTVEFVYPGATVDANGNPTDWPGWLLNDDGFWVLDPSDAHLREGITIVAEINPTATTTISYPPETAACASPDGPFPPPPAGRLPPTR